MAFVLDIGIWNLEFIWNLVLVIWNISFFDRIFELRITQSDFHLLFFFTDKDSRFTLPRHALRVTRHGVQYRLGHDQI